MRISDWSSDVCSSDLTATAGTLTLRNRDGARSAALYYTAYTVAGAAPPTDPATPPLTFVFNGGPGAAPAHLHLGLVEIGRAHVRTPVPNAHIVCRPLAGTKKNAQRSSPQRHRSRPTASRY